MPMQLKRYPPNWNAIAFEVKDRAKWKCENCDRECRKTGESWIEFFNRTCWSLAQDEKWQRYTLTVAHLDQNPGNNEPDNLKALCAVCPLNHDRPFRIANQYAKRERAGQLKLFESDVL